MLFHSWLSLEQYSLSSDRCSVYVDRAFLGVELMSKAHIQINRRGFLSLSVGDTFTLANAGSPLLRVV